MSTTGTEIPEQQNISIYKAVPAVRSLVWFNIFNAVSFNIAMSTPMILLVKRWGANNLYIGTLTALMWLMASMQLYMAPRVEYIGFRKLLLAGWTSRTVILMVVCVLPFFSHPGNHTLLLWITMICMAIYSFLRGAATTAYMPWIRLLIGPQWRGRYFSLEQGVSNLSAAATLLFCGTVMLKHDLTDQQYGWIMVASGIAGWISIFFLRRTEAPAPLAGRPKIEPIAQWMPRVFADKNFRQQILTAVCFYLTVGAFQTHTTIMLRERHVPENTVMFINGANMMAIVLSAWFWGLLADRFGSRPIMSLATRVHMVLFISWFLITLGILPSHPLLLGFCFMLFGLGYNGFHISNQRLMLNNAPKRFPVLAVATIQVFVSLSLGVAPMVWGGILVLMKNFHWQIGGGHYDVERYTLFFAASIVMMIGTKWMIRRLPNAHGTVPRQVLSYVMLEYPVNTIRGIFGTDKK